MTVLCPPQDSRERRAAKAMGVSLARKGNLELRETKETWVFQVRVQWECWCLCVLGVGGG